MNKAYYLFFLFLFLAGCIAENIHIVKSNDVRPVAVEPEKQTLIFQVAEPEGKIPIGNVMEVQSMGSLCIPTFTFVAVAPDHPDRTQQHATTGTQNTNWIISELKEYGINTTNINVDLILHSEILESQVNVCYPENPNFTISYGEARNRIKWYLKSKKDNEIIFSLTTEGYYAIPSPTYDGTVKMMEQVLRATVRKLIHNNEFKTILTYGSQNNSTPKTQQVKNNNSAIKQSYVPLTINVDSAMIQTSQRSEWASSVVSITKDGFDSSHGSGFIIGEDLILTNQHVVGDSQYVTIKLADKDGFITLTDGEVIRVDEIRDVALVKSRGKFKEKYFSLNTILPKQGDDVFVIGSPLDIGLESTLTKGIVSHPNRIMEGLPFIQSDVNILGGNSGGPMIDMNGKVIGITVLGGTSEAQGINLFIPIKSALEALSIKTN